MNGSNGRGLLSPVTAFTKLWPPSLPTRQVLIERITNDLSSKSVFTDKYGTLTTDQAVENAKRIEDGASAVQLYAKQCSKLILELLKKGHVAATRETLFEEESFDICKGQREAEESEGLVLNKGHTLSQEESFDISKGQKAFIEAEEAEELLKPLKEPANAGRPEVEALDVMDLFSNALQGSNLSSLNLSDKALGEKDALKESASPVEVLEMAGNDITVEADSAIAACVAAKRDLNKLNLSENELKDEGRDGAVALADVVMKKEGFMLLNIDGNIISEEGVEEVREIFKKKPELLGDLDENDPDEEDEEDDELESKLKNLEVKEDD
ncbi:hypothetical protein HID58_045538 [Brassica napus]|uniref:WPP domain-containing protein n=1 Tax=Brassica napus TaxID=3708 RepID=A0ABQ8ATU2_BRANA|nr:hypothetical protein HID58_045538 [Brassica napus]